MRIGAERARDHVLGNDGRDVGAFGHLPRGSQLPLQAVVERELADRVAAQAIDAAVADVPGDCPLRQQHQHAAGRAHVVKIGVRPAAAIDLGIRLAERPQQRLGRRKLGVLAIEVRHAFDGQLAGQLAGRMSSHAVGHHQQMAAGLKQLRRIGGQQRVRILIRRAAHADVGQGCELHADRRSHRCRLSRRRPGPKADFEHPAAFSQSCYSTALFSVRAVWDRRPYRRKVAACFTLVALRSPQSAAARQLRPRKARRQHKRADWRHGFDPT